MKRRRRNERGEQGVSVVETALIMPLIIFLLFMIIDTGRLTAAFIIISNASADGARAAVTQQLTGNNQPETEDEWCQRVMDNIDNSALPPIISLNQMQVDITFTNGSCGPPPGGDFPFYGTSGSQASVDIKYYFTPITPIMLNWFTQHCGPGAINTDTCGLLIESKSVLSAEP